MPDIIPTNTSAPSPTTAGPTNTAASPDTVINMPNGSVHTYAGPFDPSAPTKQNGQWVFKPADAVCMTCADSNVTWLERHLPSGEYIAVGVGMLLAMGLVGVVASMNRYAKEADDHVASMLNRQASRSNLRAPLRAMDTVPTDLPG